MKKKLLIALLAIAAAICCAFGFAACGESDNGTYYLFVEDQYVMSEYVTIDGKNWSDSNGMSGKVEIKDGTAYFYMDFFGQETLWQQGKIGGGKLELQGLSGPMTYYKEGKAHIHSFSDWQVTKEPTCTAAGQKMRVCSCGEKEQQSIPSLGHDIVSKEVTVYATCSSEGHLTNTCSRCGTFDEALPINPSSHYIDKGKDTSVCSGCGIKLADSLEFNEGSTSVSLTDGEGVNVIVPIMYAGKPVTDIGERAFSECTSLESVTIPESVTSIGSYAFEDCRSLTSINIPDSVTSIGSGAFNGCTSLENISVSESNPNYSSQDGILYNKERTDIVYVPKTIKGNLIIPDSVTSIGGSAFSSCTSLESITIPESVTSIGGSAFFECTSLESVYITDIAAWCNIEFDYSNANPLYYAENLYLNDELVTNITAEMLQGVTEIKDYAFSGCTSLESITIPESVTSIGGYAFRNCTSLTSVNIPDSVTSIGGYAFEDCISLTSINIPDSVTSIGERAFYDCTSLASITISDSVTSIGDSAFQYCESLTGVNITDLAAWCNIEFVSSSANPLYYAENLYLNDELVTEITADMLQGVTEIKDDAFCRCTSLESITIPESVTSIGGGAFYNCTSLESITIPESVTSIGGYAFEDCISLTSITIPDGVTSIGDYAFSGCTNLTSITIPDGVTSIGFSAFSGCTNLTSITIPDSVTSIGERAFYNCTSLESVYITDIAAWCNIEFDYSNANPLYYAENLYLNDELATNITADMLQGVTDIKDYAFYRCTSLESITIPDSVTSIGYSAFHNCTSLESVTFENKTGWKVSKSSSMSNAQDLTVTDDAAQNATLLRSTYCYYYWHRYDN